MKRPLISVITVVYNAHKTLEATIKSVLNQDAGLFEYWIIDGGSTDGSVDLIRKYQSQLAGWISEPDKGIYDAMNKGIDRATGEWLFFLGADDLLCTDILTSISSFFQPNLAVIYGDVKLDSGYLIRSHVGVRCLLENRLHHQSAFYNRRLFKEFRYNPAFRICADYELTLRIYLQKQPALYIPATISIFASGGASHVLTSTDINTIRGLYIKTPYLNTLFSFVIDSYYTYFRAKQFVKQKLKHSLVTSGK